MRDIIVQEILIKSLTRLYEMDYDNIRFGVSERNIEGKGVRTDVIELVYTQDAIVLFQP